MAPPNASCSTTATGRPDTSERTLHILISRLQLRRRLKPCLHKSSSKPDAPEFLMVLPGKIEMRTIHDQKDDIDSRYADLLDQPYPRFSDAEMARRGKLLAETMAAHGLDAL